MSDNTPLHPKVVDDVLEFVHLLGTSSDDAAQVLRLHALAEYYLERLIRLRLSKGDLLVEDDRFSFHHKLQIVAALDSIDTQTIGALRKLSKLRNQCAHHRRPTVSAEQLIEIGMVLGKPFETALADFDGEKREFRAMAWALFTHLTNQVTPYEIAREQLAIPTKA